MAESVDELSVNYEEGGVLLCRELDKHVLSRGAWATVMFLYQDLNRQSGEYGHAKVTIRTIPEERRGVSASQQIQYFESGAGKKDRVGDSGLDCIGRIEHRIAAQLPAKRAFPWTSRRPFLLLVTWRRRAALA